MPRRKLPSPEEYGRRLAEARQRAEKRKHEDARKTADSFGRVLAQLDEQKQALAGVSEALAALPSDIDPAEMMRAFAQFDAKLREIQAAIGNIKVEAPEPQLPTLLLEQLNEMMRKIDKAAPVPQMVIPQRVETVAPETIFSGPVTLEVTGRDSSGDIETVRVEPTRH